MTTRTNGGAEAHAPLPNTVDDRNTATAEGVAAEGVVAESVVAESVTASIASQSLLEKFATPSLANPGLAENGKAENGKAENGKAEAELEESCDKLTIIPDVCYVLGVAHDTDTGAGAVTLLYNGPGRWMLEAGAPMIKATRQVVALTGILEAIDHIRENVVRAAHRNDDAQITVVIRHDDIAAQDTITHVFSNENVINSISCPTKAMLMREILTGMVALTCDGIDVRLYLTTDADIAEIDTFASAESRRALAIARSRRAAQVVTPFAAALRKKPLGATTPESLAHRRAARFFAAGVKAATRANLTHDGAQASEKAAPSKTAKKGLIANQKAEEISVPPAARGVTAASPARPEDDAENFSVKSGRGVDKDRKNTVRRTKARLTAPPTTSSPATISMNPYFIRGYAMLLR